jgi:hypothetical protein
MTRRTGTLSGAAAVAMVLGFASPTWAQATNTPETGGQLNQCWGQVASQTAKLDTPDGTSGGGMGQHSRSTQAANNNGGFTANNEESGVNGFGITFNVFDEEDGNAGRDGVGNASAGPNHGVHPGDGGNGQHAINNGSDLENGSGLSTILDPVTGDRLSGGEVVELTCELP